MENKINIDLAVVTSQSLERQFMTIPKKAWTHISADFITKLPLTQGYNSILVVCNCLMKIAHFIVTIEKTLAKGLIKLFRDQVWRLHGLPESIVSDKGTQFAVGMIRELNGMLGIQTKLPTAYHPQTNGQTKQVNLKLKQYLQMSINHRQEQWPDWLGTVEFVYNNKIYSAIQISLFKANYGQDSRIGFITNDYSLDL